MTYDDLVDCGAFNKFLLFSYKWANFEATIRFFVPVGHDHIQNGLELTLFRQKFNG